jgi:hypothetical protein
MAWILLSNLFHPISAFAAKLGWPSVHRVSYESSESSRQYFHFGRTMSPSASRSKILEDFFHGPSFVKFPFGMDMLFRRRSVRSPSRSRSFRIRLSRLPDSSSLSSTHRQQQICIGICREVTSFASPSTRFRHEQACSHRLSANR